MFFKIYEVLVLWIKTPIDIAVRHNFDNCLKYLPYGIYERDHEDRID